MMKVNQAYQVSPIYAFFLIHSAQFGAGVLGFSRIAAEQAGYDAWIGVLLAGIVLHILMWMIYRMLSWIQGNILELQTYMFGKLFGTGLNVLFLLYFFIVSASILRTYIEIVQVWMFPTASTFILATVMCVLVYYIVSSGFRVMTAICVLSIFMSILYIFLCIYCMIKYGEMDGFLPIWNHSMQDIGDAMKKSIYTMAGSEIILMIYPFIHHPKESHRFAQYGLLFSNFLYLLTIVSALSCFNENMLAHRIWSQLSLSQLITFPFIQRFEYIMVSGYAWGMITSMILPIWACTRGIREIFAVRQRYTLLALLGILIAIVCQLQDRYTINTFITQTSRFTFYLIYIYIPILFLLFCLKVQYQKKKNEI
ncbi:GerAB/ArcD/ProY family transporter [Bacillus cereus group sp. BfR-BA-01489]|uniref:GerAB/ArcD/ProY family transporter n=1 Tax=Bacillus cereus group sp. BfR-BA-01489 TaxID=2920358 RepID=UPI001F578393